MHSVLQATGKGLVESNKPVVSWVFREQTEMEICMQEVYSGAALGTSPLREWGKRGWAEMGCDADTAVALATVLRVLKLGWPFKGKGPRLLFSHTDLPLDSDCPGEGWWLWAQQLRVTEAVFREELSCEPSADSTPSIWGNECLSPEGPPLSDNLRGIKQMISKLNSVCY